MTFNGEEFTLDGSREDTEEEKRGELKRLERGDDFGLDFDIPSPISIN